ncbi:MAG: hypothetical protein ACKVS8_04510 [Phycisphaerales bacterium]
MSYTDAPLGLRAPCVLSVAAVAAILTAAGTVQSAVVLIQWDKIKAPDGNDRHGSTDDGPYKTMLDGLMGDAKTKGITRDDVTGGDLAGAGLFDSTKPIGFQSIGFPTLVAGAAPPAGKAHGAIFQNKTKKKIGDIHINLLRKDGLGAPKDTIDPASTGGKAFPNVTISPDKQMITLATDPGKEIMPDEFLWSFITRLTGADNGGKSPYEGYLTEAAPPKKKEKAKESGTCTGATPESSGNSSKMSFDGSAFSFSPVPVTFVKYADGNMGPSDALVGSTLSVLPMMLVGPDLDIPGAWSLSESSLMITRGDGLIPLIATLVDAFIVPDTSVSGANSMLQATLTWSMGDLTLGSRAMKEFFPTQGQQEMEFFVRGNFLDTFGNPLLGTFDASQLVSLPAPSVGVLAACGVLCAARRRRGAM